MLIYDPKIIIDAWIFEEKADKKPSIKREFEYSYKVDGKETRSTKKQFKTEAKEETK